MKRNVYRKQKGPVASIMACMTVLFFSMAVLVSMGCGASQQTTLSTEQLPEEIQKMKSLEETKIDEPMAIATEPPSLSDEESQGLVKEAGTPLETTQDLEEGAPSLQKELQDEIEGIPEVSKSPSTGVSESQASSESTQIAKVAPVPLLAQPTDLTKLPLTVTDIFFDYDRYDIRKDAINDLETNAKVLIARYPEKKSSFKVIVMSEAPKNITLFLGNDGLRQ